MEGASERLPKVVVPSVYHLVINADLTVFVFKGDLRIDISILEPVSEIVLNVSDLDIKEVTIQCYGDTTHHGTVSYDAPQERATFKFNSSLPAGRAVLTILYSGVFNDKLTGFYRSKNLVEGDYCVSTFFEPTYARACLPCWDEPEFKAVFDVSVIADQKYTVLSNMNEISSEDWDQDSTKKLVRFAPSPIMSTYLLAISIGVFGEFLEAKTSNGVNVRVYLSEGNIERGKFALRVAVFSLEFFEKFFGIQYPLPKSDNFALNDFWMGAMEHWGLIIYRRTLLEVDEQKSSKKLQQSVASTVAHEYAHQWFGNLVTMQWWTHLWLNEGFASFLETICADAFDPNYQILTQFVNSKIVPVMKLDSLESSHPVEVPIKDTKQIMEIFDLISYAKGASINRMLYNFLGEEVFRKGLTNYLNHFAYKNASTDDLWKFLGDASGIDVQSLMASWTRQTGFPYLTIEESHQVSPTKRKFVITQKRFLYVSQVGDATESLWDVPLSIVCQSSPSQAVHQFVLKAKSETIEVEGIKENDWVHFNPSFSGFFTTKYPVENYSRVLHAMTTPNASNPMETFSPEGRMSFLFDCAQLSYGGHLPISLTLNMLKTAFVEEENFCVWSVIASCLLSLAPLFIGSKCNKEKVKLLKIQLFKRIMEKIGFQHEPATEAEESHLAPMLRSLVISELGLCNYEPVVSQCRKLFTEHVVGSDRITSGDVRKAVFNVIAANAETTGDIEPLLRLYSQTDMVEEKIEVLAALGQVTKERVFLHVVEFCMGPEVSAANVLYFSRSLSTNFELNEQIFKYLEGNLEQLIQRTLGNEHSFVNSFTDMCKSSYSLDKVEAMNKLRERSNIKGYDTTYAQTEEIIRVRADRISSLSRDLKTFFDDL